METQLQGVEQIFTQSPLRNFSYMLACEKNTWLCIDPYDGKAIWEWLQVRGGTLQAIANTHEHWDHTCGNAWLTQRALCPVYAHPAAKGEIAEATHFLSDGEKITLGGNRSLVALHSPGHTCAGLTFVLREGDSPRAIFTGDTFFNAGVGNCHNGGNPEQLFETISRIYGQFPDHVVVYPGHEYLQNNLRFTLSIEPDNHHAQKLLKAWAEIDWKQNPRTTLFAEEKEINTFLHLTHSAVQAALTQEKRGHLTPKQVFLELRKRRDAW